MSRQAAPWRRRPNASESCPGRSRCPSGPRWGSRWGSPVGAGLAGGQRAIPGTAGSGAARRQHPGHLRGPGSRRLRPHRLLRAGRALRAGRGDRAAAAAAAGRPRDRRRGRGRGRGGARELPRSACGDLPDRGCGIFRDPGWAYHPLGRWISGRQVHGRCREGMMQSSEPEGVTTSRARSGRTPTPTLVLHDSGRVQFPDLDPARESEGFLYLSGNISGPTRPRVSPLSGAFCLCPACS